jgi:hypothetical protein
MVNGSMVKGESMLSWENYLISMKRAMVLAFLIIASTGH